VDVLERHPELVLAELPNEAGVEFEAGDYGIPSRVAGCLNEGDFILREEDRVGAGDVWRTTALTARLEPDMDIVGGGR
jgi:hypothetical protein